MPKKDRFLAIWTDAVIASFLRRNMRNQLVIGYVSEELGNGTPVAKIRILKQTSRGDSLYNGTNTFNLTRLPCILMSASAPAINCARRPTLWLRGDSPGHDNLIVNNVPRDVFFKIVDTVKAYNQVHSRNKVEEDDFLLKFDTLHELVHYDTENL